MSEPSHHVKAINPRGQPYKIGDVLAGYGVYRKKLLKDGFSVKTELVHIFRGIRKSVNGMPISLYLANQMRDDLNANIH